MLPPYYVIRYSQVGGLRVKSDLGTKRFTRAASLSTNLVLHFMKTVIYILITLDDKVDRRSSVKIRLHIIEIRDEVRILQRLMTSRVVAKVLIERH